MKVLFPLLLVISLSFSFDKFSVGYGFHNGDDVEAFEVSLQKDLKYVLFDTFHTAIEVNYTNFEYNTTDDLYIIGVTPVVRYEFNKKFYFDAGIGASYVSETTFENERLGTSFQFRDFIGIGYYFNKKLSLSARFVHYSNADIDDDNSGLDMGVISLNYRF